MKPIVRRGLEQVLAVPEADRARALETLPAEVRSEIVELLQFDGQAGGLRIESVIAAAARELVADRFTHSRLAPGMTLGPYRIEEALGAGGMGTVYRARDTRLDRTVALKVLTPQPTMDAAWQVRFQREARAVSLLTHPHIVTLYDIASQDGIDFLVFEYVPGTTLKELIPAGGLALETALSLAAQIAGGLAAAHAAGIVHRDIKPANIIVTPETRAKILDFGLAKLHASPVGGETGQTASGVIMGTVAYMSPEQVAGHVVDHRTDIFSLGVVLYEMLCGARPFAGASQVETLHATLNAPVPSVAGAKPGIPPEADEILAKALAKDPRDRYCHAGDFELDLRRLLAATRAHEGTSQRPVGRLMRRSFVRKSLLPVALTLGGLAAGAALSWWLKPDTPLRLPERAHLIAAGEGSADRWPTGPVLTRQTADAGLSTDPSLSADGKLLAYSSDRGGQGDRDIWLKRIGDSEPIPLTRDAANESEPAFSPSGDMVAFHSDKDGGGIYVMSSLGGTPRILANGGHGPRWSPNGASIAYWTGEQTSYVNLPAEIHVVPSTGGVPRTIPTGLSMSRSPVWSPDGNSLLFLGGGEGGDVDWYTVSLAGGRAIPTGAMALLRKRGLAPWPDTVCNPAAWFGPGNDVLFAGKLGDSTNIWQIRVPPGGKAEGVPRRLTFDAGTAANPSRAADGTIAYSLLTNDINLWALPLNTGGAATPPQRLTHDAWLDYFPAVSDDGKTLAYMSARRKSDVMLRDLTTGHEITAAADVPQSQHPTIAHDGSVVLFGARAEQGAAWFSLPLPGARAAGLGDKRLVCEGCWPVSDMSADGNWVLNHAQSPNVTTALDLASGRTSELIRSKSGLVGRERISPDAKWVAFNHNSNVFLVPFRPGAAAAEQSSWIPIAADDSYEAHPQWSLDSRTVYYFSDRGGRLRIWAQRIDSITGRPAGNPVVAADRRDGRMSFSGVPLQLLGMAVARGRIIVNLSEMTGNIWMARPSK